MGARRGEGVGAIGDTLVAPSLEFKKKNDAILCYLTKLPHALAMYIIEISAQTAIKKREMFVYPFSGPKNGRILGLC